MNTSHNTGLMARLEQGLSEYEESGCKTMSAEDAGMAYAQLRALRKVAKQERLAFQEAADRQRKADHIAIVNRANIGNAAVEAAFARVGSRIAWAIA